MRSTDERAPDQDRAAPAANDSREAPVDSQDELTETELEAVVGGLARTYGELPPTSHRAWRAA